MNRIERRLTWRTRLFRLATPRSLVACLLVTCSLVACRGRVIVGHEVELTVADGGTPRLDAGPNRINPSDPDEEMVMMGDSQDDEQDDE